MSNRKISNVLTDTLIRGLKPLKKPLFDVQNKVIGYEDTTKDYTIADGRGLQLLVKTNGAKLFEIRYTINNKAKKTSVGSYPATTLSSARQKSIMA